MLGLHKWHAGGQVDAGTAASASGPHLLYDQGLAQAGSCGDVRLDPARDKVDARHLPVVRLRAPSSISDMQVCGLKALCRGSMISHDAACQHRESKHNFHILPLQVSEISQPVFQCCLSIKVFLMR